MRLPRERRKKWKDSTQCSLLTLQSGFCVDLIAFEHATGPRHLQDRFRDYET